MEENQEFSYTLIRKNVKNINLRVKSDGSVIVSANPRVPQKYIDDFVKSKIAFIEKARTGMEQDRQCPVEQKFITGEKIAYLGGHLILQVKKADSVDSKIFLFYKIERKVFKKAFKFYTPHKYLLLLYLI